MAKKRTKQYPTGRQRPVARVPLRNHLSQPQPIIETSPRIKLPCHPRLNEEKATKRPIVKEEETTGPPREKGFPPAKETSVPHDELKLYPNIPLITACGPEEKGPPVYYIHGNIH